MIVHLFNTSVVSGPERLVLPALATQRDRFLIVNLREERIERLRQGDPLEKMSRALGLRFAAVPVQGRWDSQAIKSLEALLHQLKPELVHAHVTKASVYLARCKRPASFPIVSTHHGVQGLPDLKTRLYELAYRRLFLRSFDRALCVSTDDYETVGASVPKGKLRLHLNGIDGRRVEPQQRADEQRRIRALWGRQAALDGLFLLGTVGRLSAEKDHARLLAVLAHLEKMGCRRDWRCLVFGTGDLDQALKERSFRMGLEHRVLWLGYREEIGRELAGLDLLLSFSKAEGLPINVIEAGWAGTPVMCTRVGGIKDLIPDEDYGYSIPPPEVPEESARRLQALIAEDPDVLAKRGRSLQARVASEFSQARWLARLWEIYSELGVPMNA